MDLIKTKRSKMTLLFIDTVKHHASMCEIFNTLKESLALILSGDVGSKAHKRQFGCMVANKLPYLHTPWVVYFLQCS